MKSFRDIENSFFTAFISSVVGRRVEFCMIFSLKRKFLFIFFFFKSPLHLSRGIFGGTEKSQQVSLANRLATSMPHGKLIYINRI